MSDYSEHLISMAGGDGDPLDAIQRRADKATPGPWYVSVGGVHGADGDAGAVPVCELPWEHSGTRSQKDKAFIAHARTDVPHLLALVRTQQATLAAVLNLANTSGRCGWRISADELRRTLRGES